MKKAILVLLLVLLLAPPALKTAAIEQNPDGAAPRENPKALTADRLPEGEDDIFSSSYERELLARRFFQKSLPPLSRREKIVWAFRTSRAGVLL